MGSKCLMTGLLIASLGLTTRAADAPPPDKPPEGWQLYIQKPANGYALWIPKANRKLSQKQATLEDKDDPKAKKDANAFYTVFQCEIKDDVTVNARLLNLPVPRGEEIDFTTVMEIVRDAYAKNLKGKVAKESDVMLGLLKGKEYLYDLEDGKKLKLRAFLSLGTGKYRTVYEIMVTGTKEQVEGETAKTVLNSFKHAGMVRQMLRKKNPETKEDKKPGK